VAHHYEGLTDEAGQWSGVVRTRPDNLEAPLRARKRKVWAVWTDLFHDLVDFDFVDQAFAVMALAVDQRFLILSKRPERMRAYFSREARGAIIDYPKVELWRELNGETGIPWYRDFKRLPVTQVPLENVGLGTTVENQDEADRRIPDLLAIPGRHWLSVEPMLGPIDLGQAFAKAGLSLSEGFGKLGWVAVGCETGHGRRSCDAAWVADLVVQCRAYSVPVFVKKLDVDGKATAEMGLWPEVLRVREYAEWMS
jgi:protein gp37